MPKAPEPYDRILILQSEEFGGELPAAGVRALQANPGRQYSIGIDTNDPLDDLKGTI